jgi:hypothetical protein
MLGAPGRVHKKTRPGARISMRTFKAKPKAKAGVMRFAPCRTPRRENAYA